MVASDVAGHVDALGYETAKSRDLDGDRRRDPATPAPRPTRVAADVRDEEQVAALVAETVERYGRLDILVNNAGVSRAPGDGADRGASGTPPSTSTSRGRSSARSTRRAT